MFGRDKEGKRYAKKINDFSPYIYDDEKNKIVLDSPADVEMERRKYLRTYESDVLYLNRYLIDIHKIPLPDEPIRICYMDIETNGSVDTENTPQPIIFIGNYDTFMKKHVGFVWKKGLKEERRITKTNSVYIFNNEESMLNMWIDFIKNTNPDILANHSIVDFDLPYLINRCRMLNININEISPMKQVRIKEKKGRFNYNKVVVKGRIIFDLKFAYKRFILKKLPSYSLNYICELEGLGKKIELPFDKIWDDIEKLIEYNKQDVELVRLLDEKKMLISFRNIIRQESGGVWDSCWFNINIFDNLLLREARTQGKILPRCPQLPIRRGKKTPKYEGAFVSKTIPGVHKGVFVLDLKGMYPNIMRQFNISFDTVDKENGDITSPNGTKFNSKKKGLIPPIIERLIDKREYYKAEMKKMDKKTSEYKTYWMIQYTLKVLANSVYGALGYERCRVYRPKVAESVTLWGQEIIKWSREIIKKNGYKVIYSDTDCCMVETGIEINPENKKEKIKMILEIQEKINKTINSTFDEFVKQYGCKENKYIENEFECIYESIYFGSKGKEEGAKKKYVARKIYEDDKTLETPELVIKGFEIIRRDFSMLGKKIQQQIIEMALDGKKKKEIDKYINKEREELKTLEDLDLIAVPKKITKSLSSYDKRYPQIEGAKFSNEHLNEDIKAGSFVKMIYGRIKGLPHTKVFCYTGRYPDNVILNLDKMIEITIDNKVNKLYESMGWNIDTAKVALDRWIKKGSDKK